MNAQDAFQLLFQAVQLLLLGFVAYFLRDVHLDFKKAVAKQQEMREEQAAHREQLKGHEHRISNLEDRDG